MVPEGQTPQGKRFPAGGAAFGFYIAIAMSAVTLITFVIAINTPPLSGPFCPGDCFQYPYAEAVSRFPRDYYWMYPAMLMSLLFAVFMVSIHQYASDDKKVFSLTAVVFAGISSATLFMNYFIQVTVIQPSLVGGEIYGIPLWTQYNPHGLFIALEEAGYVVMSIAFFVVAPVFSGSKPANWIRGIFISGFVLTIISLIVISLILGIHREYYFEVVVITIDFLVLIVGGFLISGLFKRSVDDA